MLCYLERVPVQCPLLMASYIIDQVWRDAGTVKSATPPDSLFLQLQFAGIPMV